MTHIDRLLKSSQNQRTRELLGWKPVEDRERFLDRAVRVHAPPAAEAAR